jgi:hypothetical protein
LAAEPNKKKQAGILSVGRPDGEIKALLLFLIRLGRQKICAKLLTKVSKSIIFDSFTGLVELEA